MYFPGAPGGDVFPSHEKVSQVPDMGVEPGDLWPELGRLPLGSVWTEICVQNKTKEETGPLTTSPPSALQGQRTKEIMGADNQELWS